MFGEASDDDEREDDDEEDEDEEDGESHPSVSCQASLHPSLVTHEAKPKGVRFSSFNLLQGRMLQEDIFNNNLASELGHATSAVQLYTFNQRKLRLARVW